MKATRVVETRGNEDALQGGGRVECAVRDGHVWKNAFDTERLLPRSSIEEECVGRSAHNCAANVAETREKQEESEGNKRE